jgi:hypothetical protein
MTEEERIAEAKRAVFGEKAELATAVVEGSGISETLRVSLDLMDDPQALLRMAAPWAENREMIVQLFKSVLERSRECPGRDHPQCCHAEEGQACSPRWREREDPEWYAQRIHMCLSQVTARVRQQGPLVAALAADEAFELGCLFTEALNKVRWDDHAKRGSKAVEYARLGGQERRKASPRRRSAEETIAAVDDLLQKGKGPMSAYRFVGREQGVSAQTIRKEYRSAKKPR